MALTVTPVFPRNAFQQVLTGLCVADSPADIFSQSCVDAWESHYPLQWGYPFTQLFEPGVLAEVARLEGVPYAALITLEHQPSAAMRRLAATVKSAPDLRLVERVNLASVLISISRFDTAERVLALAAPSAPSPRERFEMGWLHFLISNRTRDGQGSTPAFAAMQSAVLQGGVPPGRVLDLCTQGVVWYVKRREISDDLYRWCLETGHATARTLQGADAGTRSAWFRGVAMVPAAARDVARTRRYMEMARDAAECHLADGQDAGRLNALKTYYESALKEHMYVNPDPDLAQQFGEKLIALDPHWAPSYGELGDVHRHFGALPRAADLYLEAANCGPPYRGYHLLQAARCFTASGAHDRAAEAFHDLAIIAPEHAAVEREGFEAMQRVSAQAARQFVEKLRLHRAESISVAAGGQC